MSVKVMMKGGGDSVSEGDGEGGGNDVSVKVMMKGGGDSVSEGDGEGGGDGVIEGGSKERGDG